METTAVIYIGKSDESDLLNQINLAAGLGVGYLLETQSKDGYWYDYRLPVGVSDEWVTGYVGRSLSDWVPDHVALHAASDVLINQRGYKKGWGFNKKTGPDADSTANVVLFLKSLKREVPAVDLDFLLAHQQKDGGFSTYLDNKGWSISHPDVTPLVHMALSDLVQELSLQGAIHYIENQCIGGFLWPAYWWRNCFYSCFHNYQLLTKHSGSVADISSMSLDQALQLKKAEPFRVDADFDLAWLCGLYWLQVQRKPSDAIAKALAWTLVEELINSQCDEGCWLGSTSLRVTDPETFGLNMEVVPAGKYYSDHHHTITTASVLQILALAKRVLDS